MVDYFALALSHGLLALAAWRLMLRAGLDRDSPPEAQAEPGAAPEPSSRPARKPLRRA